MRLEERGNLRVAADKSGQHNVSGPGEREYGSLIELTWNDGPFLQDGDEVVLRGAPLGEVRGRIVA